MNFQQLRIIRETIRCHFNLTDASHALATSQSGVSKHIRDLEDELGVELFIRRGKRLLGLTDAGREIAAYVDRILLDAGNIKRVAADLGQAEIGELVIATTHTQARYALPPVIARFRQQYPGVHLVLHQTSPAEIADMLLEGRADIGIATEAVTQHADLVAFPYYSWRHSIVVPRGHALQHIPMLGLSDIARYPVITYHEGFTGRSTIDRVFAEAGLKLDVVMAALDADVIKAYVELGMGVGIVASMAMDPQRDTGLVALDGAHLFPESTSHIALRKVRFLRGYGFRFIEFCSSLLPEAEVRKRLLAEDQVK